MDQPLMRRSGDVFEDGEHSIAVIPPRREGESRYGSRAFWLRLLFLLDVFGAGVPGLLMLFAPQLTGDWLFGEPVSGGPVASMLGCVWLALGVGAIGGVWRPLACSPLLFLQLVYKSIWLAAVALPAVVVGQPPSFLTILVFGGWVIAVGIALPWRALFSAKEQNLFEAHASNVDSPPVSIARPRE